MRLAGLPLPGPVVGMALLFAVLLARGAVPEAPAAAADGLAKHLSLLFVPAGVGVLMYGLWWLKKENTPTPWPT